MRLLIVAALAIIAAAEFDSKLDDMWIMWRAQHEKYYPDLAEAIMRRRIWEQNVEVIRKHNLEADLGLHTYTLGLNHLADYTNEEYQALLGFRQGEHNEPVATFMRPLSLRDLPDSVDWREKGYVTPVKNQGSCGACWAFSATGSLEGQMFRKSGRLQSYSEQELVDCSRSFGNEGCGGGWMDDAFKYVASQTSKSQFLDTESCYPYQGRDLTCRFNPAQTCRGATATGFTQIKKGNESDLQAAVATVGPVSVAIDATLTFQLYRRGVYNNPLCSSTRLNHGVLAVGYGSENGVDYWIIKNSWGFVWGNMGYGLMSRNRNNQCGIATSASYPVV